MNDEEIKQELARKALDVYTPLIKETYDNTVNRIAYELTEGVSKGLDGGELDGLNTA